MSSLIYRNETYTIIGKCMEVHNWLGHGFLEIVYKDALKLIFEQDRIPFEREEEYDVYFRWYFYHINFSLILSCMKRLFLK